MIKKSILKPVLDLIRKNKKDILKNQLKKTRKYLGKTKICLVIKNSKVIKSTVTFIEHHYFYIPFVCSLPTVVFGTSNSRNNKYNDELFLDITRLNIISGLLIEGSHRLDWIKSNSRYPAFIGIELASLGMLAKNYRQLNVIQRSLIITKASLCISASTLQILNKQLGYLPTIGKYLEYPLNITSSALWGCYGVAGHITSYTNKFYGWNRGYEKMTSTASLLPPVPVPYNFVPPPPIINGTDIGFNMNFWN